MSEMTMPEPVYKVFAAVARAHHAMHQGDDEQRREATRRAVATIRARLRGTGVLDGSRWVHKTQHESGAAPSKDAFAFVPDGPIENLRQAPMYIFDTINGTTREPNDAGMRGELSDQYILVVEPHDWLEPPLPVPPAQHPYTFGDNDTGVCHSCGRSREDAIHPGVPALHEYRAGGESDRCAVCGRAQADGIHVQALLPVDQVALLQQILEANRRQETLLVQMRELLGRLELST